MFFTEEPSGALFCYILLLLFVWFRWDLRAYDFQWNFFFVRKMSSRASRTLYVGNLPADIREREVEDLFYKVILDVLVVV